MKDQRSTTLGYYDQHARSAASQYEQVDFSPVLDTVRTVMSLPAQVLELGCGSGRDAAALLASGYDVIALDGSRAMISEAIRLHPELQDRLHHHVLPERFRFGAGQFDAVLAFAVIMHLAREQIGTCIREINRVTKPGGLFVVSVNTCRNELNEEGVDRAGRYFTVMPAAQWAELLSSAGFDSERTEVSSDIGGRPGIEWVTFVARKTDVES